MGALTQTVGFEDCYRGDSFAYTLQFDDLTFDITGYQFFVTFKRQKADLDADAILIKRFTAPNNAASQSGLLYLVFESTDTNLMVGGASVYYDIQMVTNGFPPKIVTLLQKKMKFKVDVSRLES